MEDGNFPVPTSGGCNWNSKFVALVQFLRPMKIYASNKPKNLVGRKNCTRVKFEYAYPNFIVAFAHWKWKFFIPINYFFVDSYQLLLLSIIGIKVLLNTLYLSEANDKTKEKTHI
jgi:hypothetical protein